MDYNEIFEKLSWLGKINKIERIGDYTIVTYYPFKLGPNGEISNTEYEELPHYHGFYKDQNFSHSYDSLEECLVSTIAKAHDDFKLNSKAGQYFMSMINFNK